MTTEEFESLAFSSHMDALYRGERYGVSAIDFEEHLFELEQYDEVGWRSTWWVRCENVEIIQ